MDQPSGPVSSQTPPSPQPVPVAKQGLSGITLPVIGIVALLVIAAIVYFAGLPLLNGHAAQQPLPTPLPPPPVPSTTPPAPPLTTLTVPPPTITPLLTSEVRYGESYTEVYTLSKDFAFGQKEVFPKDVTQPPLFVKFTITPVMITREKVINIGLASEEIINATYPSPNAWFEVKVLDAITGAVVDEQGFNKAYSVITKQEFMVRNKGNYTVILSGNDVFAEVRILTGTA